jgi:Flp pilus assembly protein TadB
LARDSTRDILAKYERKLESQLGDETIPEESYSESYMNFREEMLPELNRYEKWAKSIGNIIKIKISNKDRVRITKQIEAAHLDVTPSQVATLSIMSMLGVFFLTILVAAAILLIKYPGDFAALTSAEISDLGLFVFLGLITSMFVFYYASSMPKRLASAWRLRASSQMVPAVLYVVVYMKHTSNLERAIRFASEHLEGPLALDFKKIFYDVEVGRFSTIKQSLENYLVQWRTYSPEFVESFHLIESSLFEPTEQRRVEILERSLSVILDGVYEKMLKYSREIRSPLTNLYMLGIILPTLALALLPLASTLLQGLIKWQHVFILFNVIVPFFVFYMVSEVLLKRPGGYGESSSLENNPDYASYKSRKPWLIAGLIAFPFLIIGFLPFLFQFGFITEPLGLQSDYTFDDLGIDAMAGVKFFDFKDVDGSRFGPFGPVAMLLSLSIPFSIAVFFSIAYGRKTKKLIKARDNTKQLEKEFSNSLFQLGNRLGDGMPAELAFGRVAEGVQGQKSASFFALVNQNVQQSGMSLDNAIFDPKRGAIVYYPSALIATSMRILVESVKKGLKIAARSLMSISAYLKNIGKINQRLRDLLAEIVSDMKSNMVFLAPLLAGIVVGLSAMITFILNKLQTIVGDAGAGELTGDVGFSSFLNIFDLTTMIPPYYIQLSVGIYIIQVIFILTGALVVVDSGRDPLKEKYELAKNLKRGVMLYLVTAFVSIFALSVLAQIALAGLG